MKSFSGTRDLPFRFFVDRQCVGEAIVAGRFSATAIELDASGISSV